MNPKLFAMVCGIAAIGFAQSVQGAITLNEIFINPPGTDNGQEFIEIRSTTGGVESMTGLSLIILEGDGTNPGLVDVVLNLTAFSTGTNGLFLWRDAVSTISPAAEVGTVINIADFTPDLENGSFTFLIVSDFTGALAQDLDTDNNGILDVTPWTSVIDAVGFIENDGAANVAYAAPLGFTNLGPDAGFNADVLLRDSTTGTWLFGDVLGTNPGGPYTMDPTIGRSSFGAIGTETLTPGGTNFSTVPEPTRALFLSLSFIGFIFRRRRA